MADKYFEDESAWEVEFQKVQESLNAKYDDYGFEIMSTPVMPEAELHRGHKKEMEKEKNKTARFRPRSQPEESFPGVDEFYTPSTPDDDMADVVKIMDSQLKKNGLLPPMPPVPATPKTSASKPDVSKTHNKHPTAGNTQTNNLSTPPSKNPANNAITNFTIEQRAEMLKKRYNPVLYKGTIFPTNGKSPYTLNSIEAKKERIKEGKDVEPDKIYKPTKGYFYLDKCLKNHVSGKENLAIFTREDSGTFIAIDFDDKTGEHIKDVFNAIKQAVTIIDSLGLSPFLYHSGGGAGFHLEVFFDKPVDINKLNHIKRIIDQKLKESNIKFLDLIYPANSAYRVFGSWHYKTKDFSEAFKVLVNKGADNSKPNVQAARCGTPDASWEQFAIAPINKSSLIDSIIAQSPQPLVPVMRTEKREREHSRNYTPKPHYYNPDILKRIHETGLYGEFKRHYTAYHLGRYFKHCLCLPKNKIEDEISTWQLRHHKDHHPRLEKRGVIPFSDHACSLITSRYEESCYDTLANCKNGYLEGKPFTRERVDISHKQAFDYINGLDYSLRRKKALVNLLDHAMQESSLNMGLSYDKLAELFSVGNRATIKKWLNIFEMDNVFVCYRKGSFANRQQSQYRLMLPEQCYYILEDKHSNVNNN